MNNPVNSISNLLFEYTHRFDAGDFASAAELFKHARIIVGADGSTVGSDELLATWQKMVIVSDETGTPHTKHMCTNSIIEVNEAGNTATAKSYYMVYQQTPTLPLQAIVGGRYYDEFECVEDQWRFCLRDYRMMEMVGDVSQHLRNFSN